MKPTGNVTFLFTDIEGSTRLSQEFPEKLHAALEIHNQILKEALESYKGFIFEITGDAFCCAFENAEDAVKAAVEIQIRLSKVKWEEARISVRIGIHSGEAEWGINKYMGYITLARTARVMSSAYGDQIIISKYTYNLVSDKFESLDQRKISFRDLGERRLKDVNQPVRLYQVISDGLREEFPPLKTLDARPNNLPVQLTSFIGRENEMKAIKDLLNNTHLLTLTGSGGAGKSRLALQIAADVIDDFVNGVWFIELAAVSKPEFLIQEILNVFDLKEESVNNPEKILKDFLRDKEILIILDNCEHLVEECAILAENLLIDNHKLKIIATSREALRCHGEHTHRVRSMDVPFPEEDITPQELIQFESARLFIERALSVDPTFRVTHANAFALAMICYRLDGIPLAIELAAARVKVLTVEKIQERLNDRFNLLTSGKRTALPRQKTLRALIDWSYDLLSEEEKFLWMRLSVFTGGWTLDAAEKICSDENLHKDKILELLEQLAEKSIIIFNKENERYTVLESIKQYGEEKLSLSNEKDRLYIKHIEYFKTLAVSAEPKIEGKETNLWLEKLDADHCNLESAIHRSVTYKMYEKGAELGGALSKFWDIRGHYSAGRELLNLLPENEISKLSLGKVIFSKGLLTMKTGQFKEASRFFKKSLNLFHDIKDKTGIAQSLYRSGQVALETGDYENANKYFKKSLESGNDNELNILAAHSLIGLGTVEFYKGNFEESRKFYEEALELYRKEEDKRGIAFSLYGLGQLFLYIDKKNEALNYYEESHELFTGTGDKRGIALSLYGMGIVSLSLKNFKKAQRFFERCLALSYETGVRMHVARSHFGLGDVSFAQDKFIQARRYYKEGLKLSEEMGDKIGNAYSLQQLANIELKQRNFDKAYGYFEESMIMNRETGNTIGMTESLVGIIKVLLEKNEFVLATKLSGSVMQSLDSSGRVLGKIEQELLSQINIKLKKEFSEDNYEKYLKEGMNMSLEEASKMIIDN